MSTSIFMCRSILDVLNYCKEPTEIKDKGITITAVLNYLNDQVE